ncbi:MAG: hypothetical protein E7347_00555 [Clostridiales bacterium]|nr:hypothetical protein [Clostridiales bacterium]
MRKFFKTVAIVTVFSTSEKFLGFLYRIYLSRTIGSEGIGLYQVALSVFGLLYTVSCSGTPVTVSRLMTKYKAENRPDRVARVITAGISVTLLFALPIAVIFYFFAQHFGFLFADLRCIPIFKIIIPGLIFTSVYSVLRGVFWGNKDFLPYSIIELLEELCMIICGIVLITHASGVYQGAFSAGVAVLISYVFSFTLASAIFFIKKNKLVNPLSEIKPILYSSVPITAMRTAHSFSSSLVSIILPMRLVTAGYTKAQAMASFGAALGQAMPLLYTPTSLINSFILVLVPEISENYYKKNYRSLKSDIERALKFTIFLTSLFVPVFWVCGSEIGIIIFGGHACGDYLTLSSFLMLFMSLSTITTSMLNSMGMENKTLIYFIISGFFMLLSVYFLPKYLGIYALIVGYVFIYGLATILNLRLLKKHCKYPPSYKKFLFLSVILIFPTALFGFLIKTLLLSHTGIFLTAVICSILMLSFLLLLFFGFGLIDVDLIKNKLKRKKA